MKTAFSRTFIAYGAIFLAALLLVGVSFQLLVKNYLTDKAIEDLKTDSSAIARVAAAYYADSDFSSRDFLINLSVAASVSGSDAIICDAQGTLLLCSHAPLGCEHQGMQITSDKYLQSVLSQEYVVSQGVVQGLYSENRYIVSACIRDVSTDQPLGFVMMSSSTASTRMVIKRLSNIYLSVSVLVVLVAVVVMTIYTRKDSAPLRELARAANAFGHGDLKARVTVPEGPEELRELSLSFNNMARSLEKGEYQRQEFVANVSHELKTPMTTISGYVDGILDGTIPPEQQSRYLQIVSDETKRLNRLVRSMLDISRLQEQGGISEDRKTRFDITECAGQVLINFEQKITHKELQVQVDMPEHPVYTHACQDAITQVIYNLVDNAVKFCPQGGTVGLRILFDGTKAYTTVYNDGQTIPAHELPLVFDRFHKTDKSRSQNRDSWGLGLYIVKTIICSHGEDISVASNHGRTEFTFTLPLMN